MYVPQRLPEDRSKPLHLASLERLARSSSQIHAVDITHLDLHGWAETEVIYASNFLCEDPSQDISETKTNDTSEDGGTSVEARPHLLGSEADVFLLETTGDAPAALDSKLPQQSTCTVTSDMECFFAMKNDDSS